MDAVDLRVFEGSQVIENARHSLPLSIGRGVEASIRVASPDKQISRRHASISERKGRLVLTDTSVNGTRYRGRVLKDAETELADSDEFFLQQYRIEIRRVAADEMPGVFCAIARTRSRERVYTIGPAFLVLHMRSNRPVFDLVRPKNPEAILASYEAAGQEALTVFASQDDKGVIATTPAAKARGLLINRGAGRVGLEPLHPLDVVSLGGLRIDILTIGQRAIQCTNRECELLNPYKPDENCRFCGHRLVEAKTRVVAR